MWSTLWKLHTYMLFNSFESYDSSLSLTLFKAETAPIRHLVKSGSDLVWSVIVRPVHGFFAAPDSCIQPNPVFLKEIAPKKGSQGNQIVLCVEPSLWLLSFLSNAAITGCHPKSGSLLWGSELVRTGSTPENSSRESENSLHPWCCWASFEGSLRGIGSNVIQENPFKDTFSINSQIESAEEYPKHMTRITTTKK